uniref:Protein FAM136A n=1 Tax=Mesocestoides corti TaxID=53468 RepID=A0A5K3F7X4_MESCO
MTFRVIFLPHFQSVYFDCGKKCCDHEDWDTEQVQSCIERCEKPVGAAQNLVQNELSQLQNRLQTCIRECSHRAYDKFKGDEQITDSQRMLVQKESLACSTQCVDEQLLSAIPATMGRISTQLEKLRKEQFDN